MVDFEEKKEEMSEIQRVLHELKDSNIGFENYKKYFDKVKNSDAVITTQITNRMRDYEEYREKYREEASKDSFKQVLDNGFITRQVYDFTRMMNRNIMEAYSWKSLQQDMYSIVFNKLFQVLDDAKALDIKRDALKEMREMDNQKQEMFIEVFNNMSNMFKETVMNKFNLYDDKLFNLILQNDEEHRKDRRDIFKTFKELVYSMVEISEVKKNQILSELSKVEVLPKVDRLTKKPTLVQEDLYQGSNPIPNIIDEENDGNDDIMNKMRKMGLKEPTKKKMTKKGISVDDFKR